MTVSDCNLGFVSTTNRLDSVRVDLEKAWRLYEYVHSGPQTPDLRCNPVRCREAADVAEVRPCVAEVRRDILDTCVCVAFHSRLVMNDSACNRLNATVPQS